MPLDHLMLAASSLVHGIATQIVEGRFGKVDVARARELAIAATAVLGVGLVPEACAARYVASGNVVALRLDETWALRQWNICVQDSHTLPPPVKLLLKHLTENGKAAAKPAP